MDMLKEIEIKFSKIQIALDECNRLKALLPSAYQAKFQEMVDADITNRLSVATKNISVTLEGKMQAEIAEVIRLELQAANYVPEQAVVEEVLVTQE